MSDVRGTGREYVEKQYADDRNLAARQSIYEFQRPRLDIHNGSLDLAQLRGDEAVLDVGCGNGRYLAELRARGHRGFLTGMDLSAGMLRTARPAMGDGPLLVGDAQALPFPGGSFDVVLAMHMMYHVPDRARAIAEIRRVLRPGSCALVLTNSNRHLRELDELLNDCAAATVPPARALPRPPHALFTAENARPELEAVFGDVDAHPFASDLAVVATDPVVAYARSMGAFVTDDNGDREPVLAELERRVAAIIATDGAFRVTTVCACFVCR